MHVITRSFLTEQTVFVLQIMNGVQATAPILMCYPRVYVSDTATGTGNGQDLPLDMLPPPILDDECEESDGYK